MLIENSQISIDFGFLKQKMAQISTKTWFIDPRTDSPIRLRN